MPSHRGLGLRVHVYAIAPARFCGRLLGLRAYFEDACLIILVVVLVVVVFDMYRYLGVLVCTYLSMWLVRLVDSCVVACWVEDVKR